MSLYSFGVVWCVRGGGVNLWCGSSLWPTRSDEAEPGPEQGIEGAMQYQGRLDQTKGTEPESMAQHQALRIKH